MRGSVTKKGNKWYIVVFLGFDQNGKRKYKWFSGYDTKKAAERDLPNKLKELNEGTFFEPSKETMADFLKKWLADKKRRVRLRTFEIYERTIRIHIAPHIGQIEIGKLKPYHLRDLYNKLQSGNSQLSNRYVSQIHTLLHDALKTAVRWEYIHRNVAEQVDAPKPVRKKFSVWTLEETQRFIEIAQGHRFYIAFLLALTTGMRQGEILALRWSDIDLENGRIYIQRTVSHIGKKLTFAEPKSESGNRMITLPEEVTEALLEHKANQEREKELSENSYDDQDLVVSRINGNIVSQAFLRQHFTSLIKKAGLPYIRFHDLRHTHASLLLLQGVHPKVVSERLGHSNIGITMNTYSHILPGLQEQATKEFGEALFRNKKPL